MIVQCCWGKNPTCIECHSIEIGPCDMMLALFRVYRTHSTTFEGVESKILDFSVFLSHDVSSIPNSPFMKTKR